MRNEDNKFIQQQNQSAGRTTDKDMFVLDNYGGVNKTSSPINIPYTDSPDMMNMDITLSGHVKKRAGSILRKFLNYGTAPKGMWMGTFLLPSGELLLLAKLEESLLVYLCPEKESNDELTLVEGKYNIWSERAKYVKPSVVLTSEATPRFIFATGVDPVVELNLVYKKLLTNSSGYPYETSPSPQSYDTFIQGTTQTTLVSTLSVGNTTTYTTAVALTPNSECTTISFVATRWGAAMRRTADQVMGQGYRFNLYTGANPNIEEKLVQIPVEIQRGVIEDAAAFTMGYGTLPITLYYQNTSTSTAFTYANPPATATEYAFSSGIVPAATTDYVTFGSTYVAFGALAASGTAATSVYFHRQHFLWLNGGRSLYLDNLSVVDNLGVSWAQETDTTRQAHSAVSKKFMLYNNTTQVTSTSGVTCNGIGFTADYPQGLNCDWVEILDASSTGLGILWFSNKYNMRLFSLTTRSYDGLVRPVYGLGMYQNAEISAYPRYLALFQGRLYLSGFSNDPMLVLVSNVTDNGSYYSYQNFDVLYSDSTLAYNPVELRIDSGSDDLVTGMINWQNSLFIFTKHSVRRLFASNGTITPTDVQLSLVGSVGCVSFDTITKTDRNVHFLSDSGFYKVDLIVEVGNYYVEDVGIKVNRYFTESSDLSRSWAFWNQKTDSIWLCIPDKFESEYAREMLVYFAKRDAWSVYSTYKTYFNAACGTTSEGRVFLYMIERVNTVVDSELTYDVNGAWGFITEFDRTDLAVDFYQEVTYAELAAGYKPVGLFSPNNYKTLSSGKYVYSLLSVTDVDGFRILPVENYYDYLDMSIWDSTITTVKEYLTGGEDYTLNYVTNTVKVLTSFADGDKLLFSTRVPDNQYGSWVSIYENTTELTAGTEFNLVTGSRTNGGNSTVTFNSGYGDSTASYSLGVVYPCWHVTPSYTRDNPDRMKQAVHYIGYYNNRNFSELNDDSTYKVNVEVDVAFMYNDTRTGYTSADVYRGTDLVWDMSIFGTGESIVQETEVSRIREPILGSGYSLSVCNFNMSPASMELVGYEIETKTKGKNSRGHW